MKLHYKKQRSLRYLKFGWHAQCEKILRDVTAEVFFRDVKHSLRDAYYKTLRIKREVLERVDNEI